MPRNSITMSKVFTGRYFLATIAASLLLSGCAGEAVRPNSPSPDQADAGRQQAVRDPGRVEKGDLVRVNYTVTMDDGSLVTTTIPVAVEDKAANGKNQHEPSNEHVPVEVLAGETGTIPGLGEAVLGMAAGERKRFELPAGKAFGSGDERKLNRQPRENIIPRTVRIQAREFVDQFNSFPIIGKEVPLGPYITARVGEVDKDGARLDISAKDGARFEENFGTVEVHVADNNITLKLDPRVGASFSVKGEEGRVTAVVDDSFTVDFNHPLAGKRLTTDLALLSVTKAGAFSGINVSWLDNHDQGLAAAKKAGKPSVLVLYAEWCQWCKKLFGESVQDLRVKELMDNFVWIRVNSNLQEEFKKKYGQNGFPLIVLLHPDGTVAGKIDGFRDGAALAGELRAFLATGGRKPVL